jgi:hypothetical protein
MRGNFCEWDLLGPHIFGRDSVWASLYAGLRPLKTFDVGLRKELDSGGGSGKMGLTNGVGDGLGGLFENRIAGQSMGGAPAARQDPP